MGMARKLGWALPMVIFILSAAPVWAHTPGLTQGDFAAGFLHPFTGVDHMLAMLAVGVWAALRGGHQVWRLPLAFMAVMTAGGFLGISGFPLFTVEEVIALSVLVLGLMIALSVRLSGSATLMLVAGFALFHGHAHGVEGAGAASLPAYVLGFVMATGVLHAAGIALGWMLGRGVPWLPRLAGGAIAAAGMFWAAHLFYA